MGGLGVLGEDGYVKTMYEALKSPSFEELYKKLIELPDHVIGEIIAGELVVSPRPALRHSRATTKISREIGNYFDDDGEFGGWLLLVEPELHLGEEALVPDIAGWRRETIEEFPDEAVMSVAPDWICEVLSPSTWKRDKKEKARSYHAAGVNWYWLVSPQDRTVEALRREGAFWVRVGLWSDDEKAKIEPFDAVALDLSRWWKGVKPPKAE